MAFALQESISALFSYFRATAGRPQKCPVKVP
jgi:hypothetical protein